MLKVYHTYKKKVVPFKPINDKKVGIYNCGPTVYDYATIGNLRTFFFYDFLRRSLEYLGYDVKQVMNITDVGHLTMTEAQKKSAEISKSKLEITDTDDGVDRMEKAAKKEGLSTWDIANKYTESLLGQNWSEKKEFGKDGDFGKLNILKPHFLPKATDHIKEQIEFIQKLEKAGYTYQTKQAVYFDISKFKDYEKLVGQKLSEMKKGDRADETDPERKHPADFRLWQLNQPDHEMLWESPWGKGYPGWHIECSAMSRKYLGQPFDIHTGGEDHIKLHHVDEIAQSKSAYNEEMAEYWMHAKFLTVDGRRMGKSLGNAYTMNDIQKKGYSSLDLRYFYLQTHYRSKQDFTWDCLENARCARESMLSDFKNILSQSKNKQKVSAAWKKKFQEALEDDINSCKALTVAWELIRSDEQPETIIGTLLDFDKVLGLDLSNVEIKDVSKCDRKEIEDLIDLREEKRTKGNWEEADKIRDELKKKFGVEIKDTKEGTLWKVIE